MPNPRTKSIALTLFLLFASISGTLFAQNRKNNNSIKSDSYSKNKETDEFQPDGPYQIVRASKTMISGAYRNGKKDGAWIYSNYNSAPVSKKWYSEGQKIGTWQFFTAKDELEWTYDFGTRSVRYLLPPSSDTATYFYLSDAGSWERSRLDKAPLALNSQQEWIGYLNRNFQYPAEAVDKNLQGAVTVAITVDENGMAVDYAINDGAAAVLNDEALRVVKGFHHQFIAAETKGKIVKSKYIVPVRFELVK